MISAIRSAPIITRMWPPPSSIPLLSEENHWMVEHHAIFQGYYFFHFLGLDRDMRERFRGHPHFGRTEEFCRLFDQVAFDPNFKSMPLEAFDPIFRECSVGPGDQSMSPRRRNREGLLCLPVARRMRGPSIRIQLMMSTTGAFRSGSTSLEDRTKLIFITPATGRSYEAAASRVRPNS